MKTSPRERSVRSEGGFTLLEMIIAVTLVAMMAVGLWGVFSVSVRAWTRGAHSIDANQRHRSVLDMVRKQMASAYALSGEYEDEAGISSQLIFNGLQDSLLFISLNSLQFLESPGLTLVRYEVSRDSQGNYVLVEKEARYVGQKPDEESSVNPDRAVAIFENLSSCTFEYLDPGSETDPPKWVREWDGQALRRMPAAVSMTLVSRDPSGETLSRHLVIPLQAKTNETRATFLEPFRRRGRMLGIQ